MLPQQPPAALERASEAVLAKRTPEGDRVDAQHRDADHGLDRSRRKTVVTEIAEVVTGARVPGACADQAAVVADCPVLSDDSVVRRHSTRSGRVLIARYASGRIR